MGPKVDGTPRIIIKYNLLNRPLRGPACLWCLSRLGVFIIEFVKDTQVGGFDYLVTCLPSRPNHLRNIFIYHCLYNSTQHQS